MPLLDKRQLRQIAQADEPHCVSIYMPTHPAGLQAKQDPIRLKNHLQQSQSWLEARGLRAPRVREMLEPAWRLVDDIHFWEQPGEGLALFLSPAEMRTYRVPLALGDLVVVDQCFDVVPLLPLVADDARFYILVLSPKRVRLLEATRYVVSERDVPGMPEDFGELSRYIEMEKHLHAHTAMPRAGPPGSRSGGERLAFHGQGSAGDETPWKRHLLEFCQMVARSLEKALAGERTPLVLAADMTMQGLYGQANGYPYMLAGAVAGSPDRLSDARLRDEGWKALAPQFDEARRKAPEKYGLAASRGLASHRLEEILPAAYDGRLDTLLVVPEARQWGRFDPAQRNVEVHDENQPEDRELVNLAVVLALRKDAAVYALAQEAMPEKAALAAVYRF